MGKHKQIIVVLNEDMQSKLAEIQDKMGFQQRSDTIRYCISFTLKKNCPEYVKAYQITPQEKALARSEVQEFKDSVKVRKQNERIERLVKELDGVITKDGECKFNNYTYVNKNIPPYVGPRIVPVEDLTEEMVQKQYKGASKKEILAIINKQENV
jgi:hypothetical protein